jgi:hypothetical protein
VSWPGSLPPLRILVALVVTVVALGVLAADALFMSDDPAEAPAGPATTSTTTTSSTVAGAVETSVVVAPDWYPKGSSRYSDRQPAVTVTTIPPTDAPDGSGGR